MLVKESLNKLIQTKNGVICRNREFNLRPRMCDFNINNLLFFISVYNGNLVYPPVNEATKLGLILLANIIPPAVFILDLIDFFTGK